MNIQKNLIGNFMYRNLPHEEIQKLFPTVKDIVKKCYYNDLTDDQRDYLLLHKEKPYTYPRLPREKTLPLINLTVKVGNNLISEKLGEDSLKFKNEMHKLRMRGTQMAEFRYEMVLRAIEQVIDDLDEELSKL